MLASLAGLLFYLARGLYLIRTKTAILGILITLKDQRHIILFLTTHFGLNLITSAFLLFYYSYLRSYCQRLKLFILLIFLSLSYCLLQNAIRSILLSRICFLDRIESLLLNLIFQELLLELFQSHLKFIFLSVFLCLILLLYLLLRDALCNFRHLIWGLFA